MGGRQARLNALLALSLAGVVLAPLAHTAGPRPQDADPSAVEEVRAAVQSAAEEAAGALDAVRAALRSGDQALARLAERLGGMAKRATTLQVEDLRERAVALSDEVQAVTVTSELLMADVDAAAGAVASRTVALLDELDPAASHTTEALAAVRAEAQGLSSGLPGLQARGDDLVLLVTALNEDVESLSLLLAQTEAPLARPAGAPATATAPDASKVPVVELVTSEGVLVLQLRPDKAPETVGNFLKLVRQGFYDGLTFHRVVPRFLVQGGCPVGDGSGGPGWSLPAEPNDLPHRAGALSMARFAHPDSAGSQFFLCLDDWSSELDGKYTVFGSLLSGQETLAAIAARGTETGVPSAPIVIERAIARARRPEDTPAASEDR